MQQEPEFTRGLVPVLERAITANAWRTLADRLRHFASETGDLDGCQWADKYRIMGLDSRYDRWNTARTPYLAEIAARVSSKDPAHKIVVVSKATQMGCTELAVNEMLRRIHLDPCVVLFFQENEDKANLWSRSRLLPAMRQRPFVHNKAIKVIGNSLTYPGGFINWYGSNSSAGLSSTTARVIIGDEVSRYPENVSKEGDFLTLVQQRTNTWGENAKLLLFSTPIDERRGEGTFYSFFIKGDQRRWVVPCPHCAKPFEYHFEQITKLTDGSFVIKCPECNGIIEDGEQRDEVAAQGWWEGTAEPARGYTSYRVNGLYAPSEWRPFHKVYEEHQASLEGAGTSMKAFYNTTIGEFFNEPEARVPLFNEAASRMTKPAYKQGRVPDAVCLLTAAFDVQQGWLAWEIKGWSPRCENWSIDRGTIRTAIENTAEVVEAIRAIMGKEYRRMDRRVMSVWAAAIDEKYKQAQVHAVAEAFPKILVKQKIMDVPRGAVMPVRGGEVVNPHKFILGVPGGLTARGFRRTHKSFRLGTQIGKMELYRALKHPPDELDDAFGVPHAPVDYPEAYYKELTAEDIVSERSERTGHVILVFKCPPNTANEALDLHVYNRLCIEAIGGLEWDDATWESVKNSESRDSKAEIKRPTREEALAARDARNAQVRGRE